MRGGTSFNIEPFYATLAMFSVQHGKISESFSFDLNRGAAEGVPEATATSEYIDFVTKAREAVFSVGHPSSDMYLVVQVEKVLQVGLCFRCR